MGGPRRVLAAAAATILAIALPLAAEETATPAPKAKSAPAKQAKEAAKPKQPAEKTPPASVKLPPAGEHDAEALLALAGILTGRTVRIEGERVRKTKVEVSEALGGVDVSLLELTILLAAHRIYLFPIVDPKEGKILVASKSPTWSSEPEMFTKILEVPAGAFDAVAKRIEKAVEEKNARLPRDMPPFVAVSSARVGRVFLRGPREPDLEEIARLTEAGQEDSKAREARRARLYTYEGRFRKVEDLEKELVEELEEGELNLLRIVVSSRGNRLLYRCPAALGEKVKGILEKLDKAKKSKD